MKAFLLCVLLTPASTHTITLGAFPSRDFCEAAKPGLRAMYADFRNARFACVRPLAPVVSPRPRGKP